MKLQVSKNYNSTYITPTLRVMHDRFFEGDLCMLSIEIVWLRWSIDFVLPSKRYDPDMLPDSLDLDDEKYASCIYGQVAVT